MPDPAQLAALMRRAEAGGPEGRAACREAAEALAEASRGRPEDSEPPGVAAWSRRALARAVTTRVSRCRKHANFGC